MDKFYIDLKICKNCPSLNFQSVNPKITAVYCNQLIETLANADEKVEYKFSDDMQSFKKKKSYILTNNVRMLIDRIEKIKRCPYYTEHLICQEKISEDVKNMDQVEF